MRHSLFHGWFTRGFGFLGILLLASSVFASFGPGPIYRPAGLQWYVRGAHNSQLNEYCVVWADAGAGNQILGFRLGADGKRHSTDPAVRLIDAGPSVAPDIAYNANANEYLVLWSDGQIDNGNIKGRFLDGNCSPIGSEFSIAGGAGAQTFPHLAYNSDNNVYMLVWTRLGMTGARVAMQVLSGNSTVPTLLLSQPVQLQGTPNPVFPHSATVAWNAFTNKFFVAWTMYRLVNGQEKPYVRGWLFNGDGTSAFGPFTMVDTSTENKLPQIAANSRNGEFLVTFDEGIGSSLNVWGMIYNSSGTRLVGPFAIAHTYRIPDWRSHAAYNERADKYFVTWNQGRGCGGSGPCDDIIGRTIAPDGTLGAVMGIADAPNSTNPSPLLEGHGVDDGFSSWGDLVSSSTDSKFLELYQIANDDINAALIPVPRAVTTIIQAEAPTAGAAVLQPFTVSGWAADPEAPTGTGVDAVHVWAYPAGGGAGVFLGAAAYGLDRPDVGTLLGDPRFDPSGFSLSGASPPNGDYTIRVYARSTVSGMFDAWVDFSLTVGPDPRMALAGPVADSTVVWPFGVSGWAIDRAAPSGTGVDAVHVWAFPDGSGDDFSQATFLGAATLGISRIGVASLYGSQFEPSGFQLDSKNFLAPGGYTFKVFAHDALTGTFNNMQAVHVTVQAVTRMAVGSPANGSVIGTPFTVSGWAFNTGTPGSVGVDAVHVWAYPTNGGAGTFLGVATLGISRPDVASFFGVPELDPSGFQLNVTSPVPLGNYTLRVFVRNTVTKTFDKFEDRSVTVSTDPIMSVGTPAPGATLTAPFSVSGWAVDLAASMGTGVDAVHVWAYPTNGGPGTFLGVATLGISRPDVASFFGDPQLEPSGYQLDVTTPLASGNYTLTIFARSTVTGTFNNSKSLNITVP